MVLDLHKIRSTTTSQLKSLSTVQRAIHGVGDAYRRLGTAFTTDPLFVKEYSALALAVREAEQAVAKLNSAVEAIDKKSR